MNTIATLATDSTGKPVMVKRKRGEPGFATAMVWMAKIEGPCNAWERYAGYAHWDAWTSHEAACLLSGLYPLVVENIGLDIAAHGMPKDEAGNVIEGITPERDRARFALMMMERAAAAGVLEAFPMGDTFGIKPAQVLSWWARKGMALPEGMAEWLRRMADDGGRTMILLSGLVDVAQAIEDARGRAKHTPEACQARGAAGGKAKKGYRVAEPARVIAMLQEGVKAAQKARRPVNKTSLIAKAAGQFTVTERTVRNYVHQWEQEHDSSIFPK